jgi:hypothetical protein
MSDLIKTHNLSVLSRALAKETFKLFLDKNKLLEDKSPLEARAAILYVGSFISLILDEVLNDRPLAFEDKALYDHVHQAYTETKSNIETIIGKAFSTSVKKFSGQELDYICEISPSPEPEGKDC